MICKKCGRKNLDKDDFIIINGEKECIGCAQETEE